MLRAVAAPPNYNSVYDTLPPIERFATILGDGSDESVALKAAHDAAAAAGYREVFVSKTIYAPTAYNMGSVIFRGPGRLTGTYRKKVIPFSARSVHPFNTIRPAQHLRHAAKAQNPLTSLIGDSTTTNNADHISQAEMLASQFQNSFLRQNTGTSRAPTFINRAIGGTSIDIFGYTGDQLIAAGISVPSWFTPTTAGWRTLAITNPNPHLVLCNFGTNNPSGLNYSNVQTNLALMQGGGNTADVIICTNMPRSSNADSGSDQVTQQEYRDRAAGALRSYAEFNGYGFLDIHRAGCILVDGFDPCSQVMTASVTSATSYSLPATLAETQQDFSITFDIDNTDGTALSTSNKIDITLSPQSGNTLRLAASGSGATTALTIANFAGAAGIATIPTTSLGSGTFPSGQTNTIEISVRNSFMSISVNSSVVFQGKIFKHGGKFSPAISYAAGSGVSSISVSSYAISSPLPTQPALTYDEAFGSGSFPNGGNGINHPASNGYQAIYALALSWADLNLDSAGRFTQSITAAGAINPDAGLVQITGPSSSTYAVTLAAPRSVDQGRMLVIEMISTTSTNAVTLALTNVSGGSASSSASFDAASERLVLIGGVSKWEVLKEDGVTLS